MPVAKVRGVDIIYDMLGDRGPFIAIQPGGRRGGVSVRSLGEKLAEAGNRVVVYDRRNTGASGVAIDGEAENDEWADDLHELLRQLDALPAFIGGSSSGCRLAMGLALRRPHRRARSAAVARHRRRLCREAPDQPVLHLAYRGGAAGRHGSGLRDGALERDDQGQPGQPRPADGDEAAGFHRPPTRWRQSFAAGADHPVIGLSPAQLRSLDDAGLHRAGQRSGPPPPARPGGAPADAERRVPRGADGGPTDLDIAFEDWEAKEGLLAAIFIDFLRRQHRP